MRLIDADETVRQLELEAYIYEQTESHGYRYAQGLIEDQPTVEAIPIEWLKKQIENLPYSHSWELGEEWKAKYATCLMVLLEEWEKENADVQ